MVDNHRACVRTTGVGADFPRFRPLQKSGRILRRAEPITAAEFSTEFGLHEAIKE